MKLNKNGSSTHVRRTSVENGSN